MHRLFLRKLLGQLRPVLLFRVHMHHLQPQHLQLQQLRRRRLRQLRVLRVLLQHLPARRLISVRGAEVATRDLRSG